MQSYSKERREAVVAKLLPPNNLNPRAVAQQEKIAPSTLYKWLKEVTGPSKGVEGVTLGAAESPNRSAKERFTAVLETASLNAEGIAQYCRRRGLYPEQIQQWRQACERATDPRQSKVTPEERDDRSALRRRVRELERELQRKEAALVEAATLLVLAKKAEAIWGGEAR